MIRASSKCGGFLQLAVLLLAAAAIQASASPQGVPFSGTLDGEETFEVAFPDLTVDGDGVGHASHLGRFTATWHREGSQLDGSLNATYEFTAANGDKLFVESVGQADLSMLPNIHVVETGTITGGTGRFEGATGTLAIERIVVPTGPDTSTTSHEIEGTLVLATGE